MGTHEDIFLLLLFVLLVGNNNLPGVNGERDDRWRRGNGTGLENVNNLIIILLVFFMFNREGLFQPDRCDRRRDRDRRREE